MKLEDYTVRQALLDERWLEAAQLVARHFGREIDFKDYQFRIGDIDPTCPEVIMYLKEGGFICWTTDWGFSNGDDRVGLHLWRCNVLIGNVRSS